MTSWKTFAGTVAVALAGAVVTAGPANAAAFPSHPITIVDAFPAGGGLDILSRVVGEELKKTLGQPVIVENRPGAGGVIGANTVAAAKADGYTLLATSSALTMGAAIRPALLHFKVRDGLIPLTEAATLPSVLIVNPKLPVKNLQEFVQYGKARPGHITVASAGVGSPAYFFERLFSQKTGIDPVDVAFKGPPQMMSAQISGEITFQFAILSQALPQIRAGSVRAIAVTSASRLTELPSVPTMEQAGVPFSESQWFGFFLPAKTPAPVVERLAHAIHDALKQPHVGSVLARAGMVIVDNSDPASFRTFIDSDLQKWQQVASKSHIAAR